LRFDTLNIALSYRIRSIASGLILLLIFFGQQITTSGVFIGPKSNGRPAKVAYVWYYYTVVQKLFRTSRYYMEGIPKSSIHPVLLSICSCIIHRVRRTICQRMLGGPPSYVRQKVAYIRTKRQEHTSANFSVHPN
jgi:hypothetical protein